MAENRSRSHPHNGLGLLAAAMLGAIPAVRKDPRHHNPDEPHCPSCQEPMLLTEGPGGDLWICGNAFCKEG
jgi:hypothetical protein